MNKPTYEVLENGIIQRTDEDGKIWTIPADPSNSDYQAYLNPESTLPSNSSDFSQPIGGNE